MGLLDNVERGLEKAVRGAFSRGSRSQVQPVEIASRIRREMDDKTMRFDAERTFAPNVFDTLLGPNDFERAKTWGAALAEELCDVVIRHARSQGYTLQGPVRVSFTRDAALKPGEMRVISSIERSDARGATASQASAAYASPNPAAPRPAPAPVQRAPQAPRLPQRPPQPVLDIDGQRYSLNASSVVLGRSSDADILVDDTGVSRRHVEIRSQGGASTAIDLGSTNGSFVDGRKIDGSAPLHDGSTISIGRATMVFRLIPATGSPGSARTGSGG
ncbi:FhaA domain-containing protein [Psychromicrobium xiongbiense]|uniref:FhaA domain-containing protein n=1 Tax=Psychromicrobium xiongbiense TaxID=3051184 RepID=UPI0025561E92|nr:DUF3662 and FHA domain-containing protein [Psychromicrobium sp. YIM S02556]